jgi:hypothetical protein
MEMGGGGAAAREDKRVERPQACIHQVDLLFETRDLGGCNAQGAPPAFRRGQVGAEIEQIVLDAVQHRVRFGIGMQPGQADRCVRLVDRVPKAATRSACFGTREPSPSEVSPWSPPRV